MFPRFLFRFERCDDKCWEWMGSYSDCQGQKIRNWGRVPMFKVPCPRELDQGVFRIRRSMGLGSCSEFQCPTIRHSFRIQSPGNFSVRGSSNHQRAVISRFSKWRFQTCFDSSTKKCSRPVFVFVRTQAECAQSGWTE